MTRPPAELVDRVTAAVIARGGRRDGGEYRYPCTEPHLHANGDAHPSARWNPDKAVWCCDACRGGGGARDLARRLGLEQPQAPVEAPGLETFAQQRRIPLEVLRRFKVRAARHAGRPTLRYPTALGVDRVKYLDGERPKYRWAEGGRGRVHWYGLAGAVAVLKREGGPLYIINGEPSVWACAVRGVSAVCLCGEGVGITEALVGELRAALDQAGVSPVALHVVYDTDVAGRSGALAAVDALRAAGWADVAALDLAPALPDVLSGDVDDLHRRVGEHLAEALAALPALAGDVAELVSLPSPVEHPEWDDPRPWPTLNRRAVYGIAGQIVQRLEPETEADPAALLATLLVAAGNAIGDGPHALVGGAKHPTREFVCVVGLTGFGRKGQSYADTGLVLEAADPAWWDAARESGLASGEGIVARLADLPDGGMVEKRALFYEPEFARVLAAAGRDKSTLSAILRDSWDTGRLRVLTRKDPLKATGAHVGVLAHITVEELRERLTTTDVANGFANRFLFVCARRARRLPSGGNLGEDTIKPLGATLRGVLERARRQRILRRTPAAEEMWAAIYLALPEPRGLFGAVTARADAHMLRLSLIYALLDGADAIDVAHIRAAEAFWRYAQASAAYVFGGVLGSDTADRLLAELRAVYPDGLNRTAQSDLFKRHRAEAELEAARNQLVAAGLAEMRREPSSTGRGRPPEVLYAVPKQAKKAKEAKEQKRDGLLSHPSLSSQPRETGEVWL